MGRHQGLQHAHHQSASLTAVTSRLVTSHLDELTSPFIAFDTRYIVAHTEDNCLFDAMLRVVDRVVLLTHYTIYCYTHNMLGYRVRS